MADDAELKEREFLLKVIQAWTDARSKIATGAILLNGAVLATAITLMKDKGEAPHFLYALRTSAVGIFMGVMALAYVLLNTEIVYERMIRNEKDVRAKYIADWRPSVAFFLILGLSIVSFGSSVVFFIKYSESSFQEKKAPQTRVQG